MIVILSISTNAKAIYMFSTFRSVKYFLKQECEYYTVTTFISLVLCLILYYIALLKLETLIIRYIASLINL